MGTAVARPSARVLFGASRTGWEPLDATTRTGLWLLLAPGVFDYRFVNTSAVTVGLYALVLLSSFLGCAMLVMRHGLKRGSQLNAAAMVCFAFMVTTFMVGLGRDQSAVQLLRVMPPLALLPVPFLAVSALWNGRRDPGSVWSVVLTAAALALVIQLVFVVLERGINFSTVRYEILSGAAPLLTGYAVAVLLFGGLALASGGVLLLHFSTLLLSVTRTQLAVAAFAFLVAMVSAGQAALDPRRVGKVLLGVVAAAFLIVTVGSALPGNPFDRWVYRTVGMKAQHGGIDITEVSRKGEAGFQLQRMSESTSGLLFGFGAAAPTAFDASSQRIIEAILGERSVKWGEAGLGHNNYVGTLYIGGILAGGAMLLMQALGLLAAMRVLKRLTKPGLLALHRITLSAPLAFVSYLAFGALAGTFGQRSGSLLFALSLAITIWLSELIREGDRMSAARKARPEPIAPRA